MAKVWWPQVGIKIHLVVVPSVVGSYVTNLQTWKSSFGMIASTSVFVILLVIAPLGLYCLGKNDISHTEYKIEKYERESIWVKLISPDGVWEPKTTVRMFGPLFSGVRGDAAPLRRTVWALSFTCHAAIVYLLVSLPLGKSTCIAFGTMVCIATCTYAVWLIMHPITPVASKSWIRGCRYVFVALAIAVILVSPHVPETFALDSVLAISIVGVALASVTEIVIQFGLLFRQFLEGRRSGQAHQKNDNRSAPEIEIEEMFIQKIAYVENTNQENLL
eukprot:PhF_6_TR44149/c0_g3_i1/m.67530